MTRQPTHGRMRGPRFSLPYTHKAFLPHVTALGQLALAWNGLHEVLAFLFCHAMGAGYSNHFLTVWHALKVDRAQRDILLAAVKTTPLAVPPPKFAEEIRWICERADVLEDARNDALHSPLWAQKSGPNNTVVGPMVGLGHVRAQELLQKHLLSEFRWCRDAAMLLHDFAYDIDLSLSDHTRPWPKRPAWLARGQTKRQSAHRRTQQANAPRAPRSKGA